MAELGEILQADGGERFQLARRGSIDPRTAAIRALVALLEQVEFFVEPGVDGQTVGFHLNEIHEDWPESKKDLNYPCAAITVAVEPYAAHSFAPTMLEETAHRYGQNTVLWKTSELSMDLQVEFYTTNSPERNAIAARLPEIFSLTESRSGIMVQGPCEYFDQAIRFTLDDIARPDTGVLVFRRERTLRVSIIADVDALQLRQVNYLEPRTTLNGEPFGRSKNEQG